MPVSPLQVRFRLSVALLFVALAFVRSSAANDVVHLRQRGSEAVIPIPAVIDEFTGRFIQFRVGTNVRRELTSDVDHIDHSFSDGFKRGQSLFQAGNFEAAEAEWKQDLTREPKPWVQREIRSWLIRAGWRQGRWVDAGNQFLAIVAEDAETFHWPLAPLTWAPMTLRESDLTTARGWLGDDRAAARLLGASLLLKHPSHGADAERVLTDLVRDPSSQVSGLAKAQLWRNRLAQPVSDNELASWRSHIAFLPEGLRGGPQYLLASACLRRSQFDRAAAEFLWVPLVYSQHEPTTARASLEAGECLLRAGRREDGIKILKETVTNYGWSPAARDAQRRLTEVEGAAGL